MKLRKTEFTKVKVKGSKPVRYEERPTSYHEISIDDIYIDKVEWKKGNELTVQPTKLNGENVLILRNISKIDDVMEFMTFK